MNCNCKKELEDALIARFKEVAPTARAHSVELQGYGLVVHGKTMVEQAFMVAEASAGYPTKTGGERWKKIKQMMVFTHCPFCGKSSKNPSTGKQGSV